MKKTCPKCHEKAIRLYENKMNEGKRSWHPVAWFCTVCQYTYFVASNTLIYSIGGKPYHDSFNKHCPKCDKKLRRIYQHKNPKSGRQQWISCGYYCNRCRYIWMDEAFL